VSWASVDCETTGLDPRTHVPWEVAVVEADGTEHSWCWHPHPSRVQEATPRALEVGRFFERAPVYVGPGLEAQAAAEVAALLSDDVTLVGSNPSFDAVMLDGWLRWNGHEPGWHYRTVCVATLAAGRLLGDQDRYGDVDPAVLELPWSSRELTEACGVAMPSDVERHTALGDARWCWRMFRHLTGAEVAA
jgi:hypothetical protein